MLTGIDVYTSNPSATAVPLSLGGNPSDDPIHIRNADGLGPVGASISTQEFGSYTGEFFTGSHVGKRNIVLTLGLNPDWVTNTPATLRRLLYKYFMPKQYVRMEFKQDDAPSARIGGFVERCEPALFSKDLEFQISIICPQPYFAGVDTFVVEGNSALNPDAVFIDLLGDVDVGFILNIAAESGSPNYDGTVRIEMTNAANVVSNFQFKTPLTPNYSARMNSIPGRKNIGVGTQSLLYTVPDNKNDWPVLSPGRNIVSVFTSTADPKPWDLTYAPLFGGI